MLYSDKKGLFMQKYMTLLKEHHIKITPQRLAIIELMDSYGHISVRDIYEKIKANFPSLSLATVYKNINAMMESDFIKELKIVGQDNKYELTKERHSHLICQKCGSIEDIHVDTSKLQEGIPTDSGFEVADISIQFFGTCKNCSS